MWALVLNFRVNSLYSVILPYTWQSALTYPILPPSAVIGLLANALQRYKNDRHPIEYLQMIEKEIEWAGSRLLTPCIVKSYTISAITKWETRLGDKFTNALGRQFAFARKIQLLAVLKSGEILCDLSTAVTVTPVTAGDSESAITLEDAPIVKEVKEYVVEEEEEISTVFPMPLKTFKDTFVRGMGRLYFMHERCLKQRGFPLSVYLCPLKEEKGVLYPIIITVKCKPGDIIYRVEGIGTIIKPK